jgi:hypothetical protein
VVSRDLDIDVQALAYLVTVLIHRLHESDPAWWREFLGEMRADQAAELTGTVRDKVLRKAISIVEYSVKGP